MEEWEKAQVIISSFLRMYSRVLYKEQLIQNEDSQHLSHTNGTGVFAPGGGGGRAWVNFCWVFAAGL